MYDTQQAPVKFAYNVWCQMEATQWGGMGGGEEKRNTFSMNSEK